MNLYNTYHKLYKPNIYDSSLQQVLKVKGTYARRAIRNAQQKGSKKMTENVS